MAPSRPVQVFARRVPKSGTTSRERLQVPSLLQVFLLVSVVLYPVWFTVHYRAVYDPDIWWHLRAGEWVLQNRAVPRFDWLSIAGTGKPWVLYSWIFDSGIAFLYRSFGLLGPIVVYPVVVILLISAVLWILTRELGLGFRGRCLVLAGVLVAIAPVCSPRPGLCSILLFTLELCVLLYVRRTKSTRVLWTLPLLFALWANIHVQFVYGLLVLALFAIEPWVDPTLRRFLGDERDEERSRVSGTFTSRSQPAVAETKVLRKPEGAGNFSWEVVLLVDRRVTLLQILAVSLTATLVNPYFVRLYEALLGLITQAGQYRYISELQPPTFGNVNGLTELVVILAAWFVIAYRRDFRWVPMCLLLVGTLLAFRTVRDVWFGVLASVVAMSFPRTQSATHAAHTRASVILGAILLTIGGTLLIARAHPLSEAELWKDAADEFPVAAVEYVKQQALKGPLYNDWNWGGFLIWNLPQVPVYVDSRTNLSGDETLERSIAVWSGAPDWGNDPALSSARLIIGNVNNPLTSLLRFDPRFRVAYEDTIAVVFVAARP